MTEAVWRLGIDLGGTKIEGVILDPDGVIVWRERLATEAAQGYDHILDRIGLLYRAMCERAGNRPHRLGIGTPGSLAPDGSGRLRNSNTTVMNGRALHSDLERTLGCPLRIENDANCFALAEATLGAGRGHRIVFGVILGTGCGGGVVIDQRVHVGRNHVAGEWGHIPIDADGMPCFCGARGCVETLASGSGLSAQYQRLGGAALSGEAIVALAKAGDARAVQVVEGLYRGLGRGLADVINVLDPDVIVLGGGLSGIADLPQRTAQAIAGAVFSPTFSTPVLRHALGDSAGVIGAALIG